MALKGFLSDNGLMEVLFWDLVGWTEKSVRSLRMAGVLAGP